MDVRQTRILLIRLRWILLPLDISKLQLGFLCDLVSYPLESGERLQFCVFKSEIRIFPGHLASLVLEKMYRGDLNPYITVCDPWPGREVEEDQPIVELLNQRYPSNGIPD